MQQGVIFLFINFLNSKVNYFVNKILGIGCWNPAFDVTPASLIAGIVTEKGVFLPGSLYQNLQNAGNKS